MSPEIPQPDRYGLWEAVEAVLKAASLTSQLLRPGFHVGYSGTGRSLTVNFETTAGQNRTLSIQCRVLERIIDTTDKEKVPTKIAEYVIDKLQNAQ